MRWLSILFIAAIALSSVTAVLLPVLECSHNYGNGTCETYYGYENTADHTVVRAVGEELASAYNAFYPSPHQRNHQPSMFLRGVHRRVFSVRWPCASVTDTLTWVLDSAMVVDGRVSTCPLGCDMVPFSYATYDACGECNGHNSQCGNGGVWNEDYEDDIVLTSNGYCRAASVDGSVDEETPSESVTTTYSYSGTPQPTQSAPSTVTPSNTASITRSKYVSQSKTPSPSATMTTSLTEGVSASETLAPSESVTPTRTASRSPSLSWLLSASETWTPTSSVSRSYSRSVSYTRTETPTGTVTPSETPSESFSRTQTRSVDISLTPSRTISKSATGTPTSSITESSTNTPSSTSSVSISESNSPTSSATPSQTPTGTQTASEGSSASPTPSTTPSNTATGTQTATTTATTSASVTATATPSSSPTPSVTETQTASGTGTSSSSGTPSNTETPSGTPSSTETPSSTVTATQTPSRTGSPTETSAPTPAATETSAPTPAATETASPTPSASESPSETPDATPTASPSSSSTSTATATPTSSVSGSETASSTATGTGTSTQTPSISQSTTPTDTPTASSSTTGTPTASSSSTGTPSVTETSTPSPSDTPTATASVSSSHSNTLSSSSTASPTVSPSGTPSNTPTPAPSSSMDASVTNTASHTATASGTATATASVTSTVSISESATVSITVSPSGTPSNTASHTPSGTPTSTATATSSGTASNTPSNTPSSSTTGTSTPSGTTTGTTGSTSTGTASGSASVSSSAAPTSSVTPSASRTSTRSSSRTPSRTLKPSSSCKPIRADVALDTLAESAAITLQEDGEHVEFCYTAENDQPLQQLVLDWKPLHDDAYCMAGTSGCRVATQPISSVGDVHEACVIRSLSQLLDNGDCESWPALVGTLDDDGLTSYVGTLYVGIISVDETNNICDDGDTQTVMRASQYTYTLLVNDTDGSIKLAWLNTQDAAYDAEPSVLSYVNGLWWQSDGEVLVKVVTRSQLNTATAVRLRNARVFLPDVEGVAFELLYDNTECLADTTDADTVCTQHWLLQSVDGAALTNFSGVKPLLFDVSVPQYDTLTVARVDLEMVLHREWHMQDMLSHLSGTLMMASDDQYAQPYAPDSTQPAVIDGQLVYVKLALAVGDAWTDYYTTTLDRVAVCTGSALYFDPADGEHSGCNAANVTYDANVLLYDRDTGYVNEALGFALATSDDESQQTFYWTGFNLNNTYQMLHVRWLTEALTSGESVIQLRGIDRNGYASAVQSLLVTCDEQTHQYVEQLGCLTFDQVPQLRGGESRVGWWVWLLVAFGVLVFVALVCAFCFCYLQREHVPEFYRGGSGNSSSDDQHQHLLQQQYEMAPVLLQQQYEMAPVIVQQQQHTFTVSTPQQRPIATNLSSTSSSAPRAIRHLPF